MNSTEVKVLSIKFKSIIIISIVFLSTLIVSWNFDLNANISTNEINSASAPKSNKYPRAGDFDWGEIEVISEPIPGNNFNAGHSSVPSIAFENDKIFIVWMDRTDYNNAGNDLDIFYSYL